MYMTTSFAFFIFTGGMAMLMRAELARPVCSGFGRRGSR